MKKKKLTALAIPALVIIIIDQVTKHWVRTTPSVQNWDIIPGWLSFHYTQNPGMALGMDWASTPVISAIAITATIGIIIYILRSLDQANIGYLLCMGLVLGGAFGNIIDRLVMGYIGSYGGILDGHVIDFIHFTLRIDGTPVFPYIFNVADVSISVAIISLLLFHQRILPYEDMNEGKKADTEDFEKKEFDSPYLNHGISGEPTPPSQNNTGSISTTDAEAADTEEEIHPSPADANIDIEKSEADAGDKDGTESAKDKENFSSEIRNSESPEGEDKK